MPPEVETHLVNAVLTNGARYYVDHAHPEYSTPECANALDAVLLRQGGRADPGPVDGRRRPDRCRPARASSCYKNNSDGKGNSYGTHENYLMDRSVPFARIVQPRHAALRLPPDLHRRRQGRDARRPRPAGST